MEVKPDGCSLVSVGRQGHICKMKGEAAGGCFHRGMERSGSGPSINTRLIVQVQGNTEWAFIQLARPSVLLQAVFERVVIRGKHCLWQRLTLVSCCYICKLIMSILFI